MLVYTSVSYKLGYDELILSSLITPVKGPSSYCIYKAEDQICGICTNILPVGEAASQTAPS